MMKYLVFYNLRGGRGTVADEAVVDAVGTVDVNEGVRDTGKPELVFWYGGKKTKLILIIFNHLLRSKETLLIRMELTDCWPMLRMRNLFPAFIKVSLLAEIITGETTPNGWARAVDAQGIGEFEEASVGEIVWVKKMPTVTTNF